MGKTPDLLKFENPDFDCKNPDFNYVKEPHKSDLEKKIAYFYVRIR